MRPEAALVLIELRAQHLQRRRTVLLKQQQHRERMRQGGGGGGEAEEVPRSWLHCVPFAARFGPEEVEQRSELEAIQRELEELAAKVKQLQLQERGSSLEPGAEQVPELGMTSGVVRCHGCGEVVATEIRKNMGDAAWILCCLSAMFGCVAGCCLIPFLIDSLKDVNHCCPNCRSHIHTHNRV